MADPAHNLPEDLILEYHRAHSNSLRLAHDLGSRSGRFAPQLAKYFQHVHVSHPSDTGLSMIRDDLGGWYAQHWWEAKFSFSVGMLEHAADCAVPGNVDLVTVMDSAHSTNTTDMVCSVAESLAPNGTMAIVQREPYPLIVSSHEINALAQSLLALADTNFRSSSLDNVELPDGLSIQDVTKRIAINAADRVVASSFQELTPTGVHPAHRRYNFSDPAPEAAGWSEQVDAQWFRRFFTKHGPDEDIERQLRSIEEAMDKRSSYHNTVQIEWTVAVLLATRK
ncbi:hypothetical protein LTR56_002245 [Elasticomyces elasticus]|nr:hypothetical protein LTR56_002245 [Elasticomyces elasticus]KAK3666122.1 hypothetical protein LTR22_003128 [Elasticomyces elasticus]KAK4929609.1 hypothetical protein LTR49_003907 [Elasticomyces elasticus]KAK5767434.1 hypothetical protein LTS12_002272 [Elasticomyces elasticus]